MNPYTYLAAVGKTVMAPQELAGVHVLLVEDTDDSRELLRIALEYCCALVTAAASAEEAKRILDALRPHVLVSDIAMPDDGIRLIREVNAVAENKGIRVPAIAITAYQHRREELLAGRDRPHSTSSERCL